MQMTLRLVLNTEKEENAKRLVARLNKIIQASPPTLERHHKGGIEASLSKEISTEIWSDAALEGLVVAQSFGRGWTITGHATEGLDLTSTEFTLPGIAWAHLSLQRIAPGA